jgi:hypothetical protein
MKKLIAEITKDDATLLSIKKSISITFGALDRGDISDTTNWGCFSNKGEVVFIDSTKEFKEIYSNNDNIKVKIYYSSNQTKKLLATFLIDDFDYEDESGKVTITLKDSLMDWQQQNIGKYYEFYEKPMSEIWGKKLSRKMCSTDSAFFKMSKSKIGISYLKSDNRWSTAEKFCQASMTRVFCDEHGTPIISDETPKQEGFILIQPQNILSIQDKVGNRKTKIESPSIHAKNYAKKEGQPLFDDIAFTWYNTRGTTGGDDSYIKADFSNSFSNVVTECYDWYGSTTGAKVSAKVQLPEHYFSAEGADITVNQSYISESAVGHKKLSTSESKVDSGDGFYTGEGISYSLDFGIFDREATITHSNTNAVSRAQLSESNGVLGKSFITHGTLNWLGNFFVDDGEVNYGDTGEFSPQISSNELIQVGSHFDGKPLAQHILDTVEEKYSNGVECVVMEVTPSEYIGVVSEIYPVIDPKGEKPLFEKYDVVIPYVVRSGLITPYSTTEDGSPKKFKIIGIQYYYKGFIKQKLYLQENKEETIDKDYVFPSI